MTRMGEVLPFKWIPEKAPEQNEGHMRTQQFGWEMRRHPEQIPWCSAVLTAVNIMIFLACQFLRRYSVFRRGVQQSVSDSERGILPAGDSHVSSCGYQPSGQ